MIQQAINLGKAKFEQKRTRVTSGLLSELGFNNLQMGDLKLHEVSGSYYFVNTKGKLTPIKNAYTLSNLVYGKIKYERTGD